MHKFFRRGPDILWVAGCVPEVSGQLMHTGRRVVSSRVTWRDGTWHLAIMTCPDLAHSVAYFAHFNINPGPEHWTTLKHLFQLSPLSSTLMSHIVIVLILVAPLLALWLCWWCNWIVQQVANHCCAFYHWDRVYGCNWGRNEDCMDEEYSFWIWIWCTHRQLPLSRWTTKVLSVFSRILNTMIEWNTSIFASTGLEMKWKCYDLLRVYFYSGNDCRLSHQVSASSQGSLLQRTDGCLRWPDWFFLYFFPLLSFILL